VVSFERCATNRSLRKKQVEVGPHKLRSGLQKRCFVYLAVFSHHPGIEHVCVLCVLHNFVFLVHSIAIFPEKVVDVKKLVNFQFSFLAIWGPLF
jgi:hypothetical protein